MNGCRTPHHLLPPALPTESFVPDLIGQSLLAFDVRRVERIPLQPRLALDCVYLVQQDRTSSLAFEGAEGSSGQGQQEVGRQIPFRVLWTGWPEWLELVQERPNDVRDTVRLHRKWPSGNSASGYSLESRGGRVHLRRRKCSGA